MTNYNLGDFSNGKAFIHHDRMDDNGRFTYGNRICINTKGEKLFELPDRDIICNLFEDEDIAFVMNADGLYAMINCNGEFLTNFIYDCFHGGIEEGLFECRKDNKHGHIDIKGREIIPCMYDNGSYFSEGIAWEKLNDKCGMIDYFNNTVIPFEYEDLQTCSNNIIPAKKNGKWGLINKGNEIVVDFIYDEIYSWGTRECLVTCAKKCDKYGFIDRCGNVAEDFIYDEVEVLSDSNNNIFEFYSVTKGDKKALYSTRNKALLTNFEYDDIGFISEDKFVVWKNDKGGVINTKGEIITPTKWDISKQDDYNEDLLILKQDNKYGAINNVGEPIIPFEYKHLKRCSEGLICATNFDGKEGYIDKKNNVIIPFGKYSNLSNFSCGLARAWSSQFGNVYINKQGEILELKV